LAWIYDIPWSQKVRIYNKQWSSIQPEMLRCLMLISIEGHWVSSWFWYIICILDSIHIIRLPFRWACYSRTKLRNWWLDTHVMMTSFDNDTNDFVYANLSIKVVIIIMSLSINNDRTRWCLWDNNQNILHKLLIIILWFLSFLLIFLGQLKNLVGQVLFLVSCIVQRDKLIKMSM
jgi:hypothetical protein